MSDTASPLVTVLGSEEWLHFECSEQLQPSVRVTFTATAVSDPQNTSPAKPATWAEQLTAEPVSDKPPSGDAPATVAMRIRWTVAHAPQVSTPPRFELTYKVEGIGLASRTPAFAAEREKLLVDSIDVVSEPALTKIMLHEFPKPLATPSDLSNVTTEFDPGPAQTYIRGLSAQQKKLLLRYNVDKFEGNRLVVFITLAKNANRRMCADFCEPGTPSRALANSSFAVFHCRGPTKGATLVCYTEHFLVNLRNPSTARLVHAREGDRGPDQWMRKNTDRPVMFKIGCCAPSDASHGVLYNRILRPNGQDVMPGNTLHGVINTVGCWMLFRNFNWPTRFADRLCDLYTDVWRVQGSKKTSGMIAKLAAAGYDFPGDSTHASSYAKFCWYDKNAAFFWFFHDLVGVEYVGSSFPVNSFNIERRTQQNRFPHAMAPKPLSRDNPATNVYVDYDVASRRKVESGFKVDSGLLRNNALGFMTCSAFAPWSLKQPVPAGQVNACTWADLYLFAEDDVKVAALTANY